MISLSMLVVSGLGLLLALRSPARAQWDDGYWFLDFSTGTASIAAPLRVGVDLGDGNGFSFQTLVDENSNGVIHLPRMPVGGRLALGGTDATHEVGCDLWDLVGTHVYGTTIQEPLLVVAKDVEGVSLGVVYGDFAQSPFVLTPGAQYHEIDGDVASWPEPRLVNDFGVPGLEEFVLSVDSLPNFSGNVLVSTATLSGTLVPKPGATTLALTAVVWLMALARSRFFCRRAGIAARIAGGIVIATFAALTVCMAPRMSKAESFTWVFPGDGNWDTATNWTPYLPLPPNPIVGPPDVGDVAIIQTPNRVTLQGNYLALSGLLIANGASVNTNFNELSVVVPDDGGVITITGEGSKLIVRNVAGNANAFFFDQLSLTNGGELDIEGTVARIFATGGGGGGLDVDANSRITGRGELRVPSFIAGSDFNNRGTIRPDANQTIAITAPSGAPSIDLDGVGANLNSHLDLSNAGATLIVEPALTDDYSGRITLGDQSTLMIENPWTLGGSGALPAQIDFNTGPGGTSAAIAGGPLTLGGPTAQHASVQGIAGDGNFNVPVEINANCDVTAQQNSGINFNGATTINGGTFHTFSISLTDGTIEFNGPTTYAGDVTIHGIVRQQANATVSAPTIITADAFDIDGTPGNNVVWDINAPLTVNAERIGSGASFFGGTFEISGPTSARLEINISNPLNVWIMGGTMNLGGTPFGFTNRVAGSTMVVTGQLNVQQRVDISADTMLSATSTTDIDASAHILRMSGVTVVEPGATITGDGYLQNAASGNMLLPAGLTTGNVGLLNEGRLRLGETVGVVAVEEFEQYAGATLVVDVGRNKVATDSDVLTISSGMAFVDGFVQTNIVNIGGTLQPPQIGDTFTILTAVAGVSGTFDDVLDSNLGGQIFEWTLIHNPNNVLIELAHIGGLPGDYNMNGVVDAADYTVWRNTLGSQTFLAADGNQNGTVDQADYDFWKARFGNTLGVGSATAIPEAHTAVLLCFGAALLVVCRWRRVVFT